jgi:hypothetical protein
LNKILNISLALEVKLRRDKYELLEVLPWKITLERALVSELIVVNHESFIVIFDFCVSLKNFTL